jgi:lysozyme family protein
LETASVQTIADTNVQLDALEETSRSWLASASVRLNETSGGLLQRMRDRFARLEPALQTALTGAAILGGLAGFLTGLLAWKRSGVLVSSVAGAGLVLLGLWTAMESVAASSPETSAESAHLSPASWLVAFAALSLAGAGFQWYLERRGADSSPEHGATEAIA